MTAVHAPDLRDLWEMNFGHLREMHLTGKILGLVQQARAGICSCLGWEMFQGLLEAFEDKEERVGTYEHGWD